LSEEEPLFSARTVRETSPIVTTDPEREDGAHKLQRQFSTSGMSWPCSLI
jgi:hypothetical protein